MASPARRLIDRMPSGPVQLAYRVQQVVAPRPWPTDQAAVELYRAERAHKRGLLPYPPYLYRLLAAARPAVTRPAVPEKHRVCDPHSWVRSASRGDDRE